MEYIDIHSHLNFPDFDIDREEIIAKMKEKKVSTIVVGTTFEDSKKAIEIAEKHENIWAIVGLHPIHADQGFNYEEYKKIAKHEKVVGIGECGFDYKYNNPFQSEVFEKQIMLANEINKPLMLHIRDAYKDAYDMVKSKAKVKGNSHFFAGSWEDATNFLDLGFTLSFTGVITFTHDYDFLVKNVPSDKILSETDSPYVSPQRGKRNTPLNIIDIVAKIADLRQDIHSKSTILKNAKSLIKSL